MWEEYFPNATIHGVDINPECKKYESGRIKITVADQGNESQLKELEKLGPFDLIVDDGSHFCRHQILSFKTLFPFVKKGGIYVIEDAATSYWPAYEESPTCMEYFKNLIDKVSFNGKLGLATESYENGGGFFSANIFYRGERFQSELPDYESIHFMNSVIVIHRREEFNENKPDNILPGLIPWRI
jgi:hypothetical protein